MRVLHAPNEISNQTSLSVRGLRCAGVQADCMVYSAHHFDGEHDYNLKLDEISGFAARQWAIMRFFHKHAGSYDLFHFHFALSILPRLLDLRILKSRGKALVMEFWGSDIRMTSIAKARNRFYGDVHQKRDESRIVPRLRRIRKYVDHVIVGDHELKEYAETVFDKVIVVPQRIDTEALLPAYPKRRTGPVVVHAPSNPVIKGTEFVFRAVENLLKKKHDFKFVLVHGKTHAEAKALFRDADIIVDQLILGAHGVFAVEAMAMGKPVICHIREDLIHTYPQGFPIVNANPETIERVLETLIADYELRRRIGEQSREYAEAVHDYKKVGLKLKQIYEAL